MGLSYKYDVFISHAVEDKISIATELCGRLKQCGLEVWYSGSEFNIGDSIEKAIFKGLAESRYCIVIISPNYLSKQWPIQEFHALLYKERDGEHSMLPILHNMTLKEITERYPFMTDRWCIPSDKGMDYVVDQILRKVKKVEPPPKQPGKLAIKGALFASVIGLFGYFASSMITADPGEFSQEIAQEIVENHAKEFENVIQNEYLEHLKNSEAKVVSVKTVDSVFFAFKNFKSRYRNEYEFHSGSQDVKAKKNVVATTGIDVESLSPKNNYGFKSSEIYMLKSTSDPLVVRYAFVNSESLKIRLSDIQPMSDDAFSVIASFDGNIRCIVVTLVFADSSGDTKRHQMILLGFLKEETYVFRRKNGDWTLSEMK